MSASRELARWRDGRRTYAVRALDVEGRRAVVVVTGPGVRLVVREVTLDDAGAATLLGGTTAERRAALARLLR